MKKNLQTVFMLLFAMVAFTGCKKDDEKGDKPDERLIGKWQMESIATGSQSVTVPANRASFITLNANGSVILDLWSMDDLDPAEWTKVPVENAKYTINGQTITVTYDDDDDDSDKYTVKELTDTRLVLEGLVNDVNATMTFKKV